MNCKKCGEWFLVKSKKRNILHMCSKCASKHSAATKLRGVGMKVKS